MMHFSRPIHSAALLFLSVSCCLDSSGATVRDIRWDTKQEFTRCVVELNQPVPVKDWDYRPKGLIYLDIYTIEQPFENRSIPINGELLKTLHIIKYPQENVLRLVYNLNAEAQYTLHQLSNPDRLVLDLFPKNSPLVTPAPAERLDEAFASGGGATRKKLIIIDPGHGGRDPGAVSPVQIGGREVQEKDLTLRVVQLLRDLIGQSPHLECRLTRESDQYVTLDERVRFAEAQQADMFISIHYNSAPKTSSAAHTRGLELYYLNPAGSSREATRLLEQLENQENATGQKRVTGDPRSEALFKKIVTERLNRQIQLSYHFCRLLQDEFERVPYFKRHNRGIKDANFRVLNRQYSRPAVLIEVGYLSNRAEVQVLVTEQSQRACAVSIFNAINRYFAEADPRFVALRN